MTKEESLQLRHLKSQTNSKKEKEKKELEEKDWKTDFIRKMNGID
jgi:hypothetical protein